MYHSNINNNLFLTVDICQDIRYLPVNIIFIHQYPLTILDHHYIPNCKQYLWSPKIWKLTSSVLLYQHEKFYLINKNCTWCSYDVWFYPSASTQIPRFATLFGHWQLVGHLLPCQFGQSVRQRYSAFWPSSHSSLLKGTKTCVIQFPYKALEHLLIDCQKKTKPTYKEAIIQQQNEFKIKIIQLA